MAQNQKKTNTPHQPVTFKKSLIALCIMAAGTSSVAAESTADTPVEEIVVTGSRAALQNAQEIKRSAETTVDAISASDISSLPDANVMEALARVPGITIERFASSNDPDHFSIEGSGAKLRGLSETRSEFNGRDTFSANSRRGLSWEDISPELMGSIEVYKNQTANMVEGGIAGTVNLNTRKPFDQEGQKIAFTLKGLYGDFREDLTPSISALYSNRWETGAGEFGLLASVAKTTIHARSDGVQIGAYSLVNKNETDLNKKRFEDASLFADTTDYYAPDGAGIRTSENDRSRLGSSLAAQWQNTDATILATLEWVHSNATEHWVERNFGNFESHGLILKDAVFVDGLFKSGTYDNYDSFAQATRGADTENTLDDYSFHLKLLPTDALTLNLDVQHVAADRKTTDLAVYANTPAKLHIVNNGSDLPGITFMAPSKNLAGKNVTQTDVEYFTDPNNYYARAKMEHHDLDEGDENAYKLDVKYELDLGFAKSIESGVRFAERDSTSRGSQWNWGEITEQWAGGGKGNLAGFRDPESWDGNVDFNQAWGPVPEFETYTYENFQRSGNNHIAGGQLLSFTENNVANYQEYLSRVGGKVIAGSKAEVGSRMTVVDGSLFIPTEINPVNEKNSGIYLKLNFGNETGDLSGNLGVRYVTLDREVSGGTSFSPIKEMDPVCTTPNTSVADCPGANGQVVTPPDTFITAEDKLYAASEAILASRSSTYTKALPSFNLKYDVTDEIVTRFAVSQAVAYPDLGNLRLNYSVGPKIITFVSTTPGVLPTRKIDYWSTSGGTPDLKPQESTNYDLSAEWYFSKVGALSATVFHKDISNFFADGSYESEIAGGGGITRTVRVGGAINQGDGKLDGIELAYQNFFDFLPAPYDGLGVQMNYTHLKPKNIPTNNLRSDSVDATTGSVKASFTGLPLQGLSENSYNIVAMYEKNAIKFRLAYNWRSDYLLNVQDVITRLPVYSDATGNLDTSMSYQLSDNFEIGLEVTNLLDSTTRTSVQFKQDGTRSPRSWFNSDRRYGLVLKGNF